MENDTVGPGSDSACLKLSHLSGDLKVCLMPSAWNLVEKVKHQLSQVSACVQLALFPALLLYSLGDLTASRENLAKELVSYPDKL